MKEYSEASFEEALTDAVEEAVNEPVEEEAVEEETYEVEEGTTEESPLSEDDSEDAIEAEEVEAESEEVIESDDSPSVELWNGNPDELPPPVAHEGKMYDLSTTYKNMQAGFTRKMQELSERDRQREEVHRQTMEQLQGLMQKAEVEADPRPVNPSQEMSVQEQEKQWDKIAQWNARQVLREQQAKEPAADAPAEQDRYNLAMQRLNMIRAQDGYTSEVESRMDEIVANDPYWYAQVSTDDGAVKLFTLVKQELELADMKKRAAELEASKIKRSASASKKRTPKPTTQTKQAESPDERFADLAFNERIDRIVDDAFEL